MSEESREAGRELDALIAEKVMGWTVDPIYRMYTGAGMRHAVGNNLDTRFNPSTNIAAAWEVVEKMRERGDWVNLEGDKEGWMVEVWPFTADDSWAGGGFYGEDVKAKADTAPLAICRAALKALNTPAQRP